jgi:hypothetical protein
VAGYTLDKILKACAGKSDEEYARAIKDNVKVEEAYNLVSIYAQSALSRITDNEGFFHLLTIVNSLESGQVFELDGNS